MTEQEVKVPARIVLECRNGNNRGCDDGQCDPHPFAVEEDKKLVVRNRAAETTSKVIHCGYGLVVPRSRIGEVVRCIK